MKYFIKYITIGILFALAFGCKGKQGPQDTKRATAQNTMARAEDRPARADAAEAAQGKPGQGLLLNRMLAKWTGDLPEIREKRRYIRVLTSYSNTNYFIEKGRQRGLEYELLHQYEHFLNKGLKKGGIKTRVVFIVKPFDRLIPALLAGQGDIAAADLTITPERQKLVAFTRPYIRNVNEILVASRAAKKIKRLSDLSGKRVYVVAGSSYAAHLKVLNKGLVKEGLKPIRVIPADTSLEAEDLLQMVNAGIFQFTVVDSHIAELWSQVLKNIVLIKEPVIHSFGNIAWAVRKGNPELLRSLDRFLKKHGQGTLMGNILIKRYYQNTKWISNPLKGVERKRFMSLQPIVIKYARQYGFDWLKIAALAYQESQFDQSARSPSGALGIMQIRPKTAAGPNVGIPDITNAKNNIHAGIKYLAFIRNRYFNKVNIAPDARVNFTFAAYNAGPACINDLRQRAKSQGLNPNVWFFNVERVARSTIGRETVVYVANIDKYYIAYKTIEATLERRTRRKDELKK